MAEATRREIGPSEVLKVSHAKQWQDQQVYTANDPHL